MSTRQDNVQIRVDLDTTNGINEMGRLENEILETQRSMKGLKRDTEEWKAAASKLDGLKNEVNDYREKLGLAGLTMRQLTKYQGELKQQMANLTYGTEKWKELDGRLQEVTSTINTQRGTLSEFQKGWQNVKGDLLSMGAQAAVVGVLVGIGAAITQVISKSGELSDSLSNVQKTTGMTSEDVGQLNEQLSKVDTRTARDELRSIAAVAGQLAIPNEQILGFVKATDKLNVALGDEIQGGAEEVTRIMGGLRNVLTDIKTDDVGTDMLHIGNALNVLAAEGAATAPVVADIANRIGGVGQVMGLTSGQTLGLSATMQELNITAERGGTAVVKILQHMAAAPEKFAAVTQKSGAEFRKMVDTDIYGALKLVMEGAAGSGAGATKLASTLDALGVDGAGASEVIAKMGLNVKMLDDKTTSATKSLTDTKSIIGEFNTLNDNFAGKLERIGKWWNGLFTANSMKPMLEGLVGWLDGLTSVRDEVELLGKAWQDNQDKMANITQNVEPLLARYKELVGATDDTGRALARNGEQQAELDQVIQDIAKHIPEAVTAWNELGLAQDINAKSAENVIKQQKAMLKVKNADAIKEMDAQIAKEEQRMKDAIRQKNQIMDRTRTADGSNYFWVGDREALDNLSKIVDEAKGKLLGLRGLMAQAKGDKTAEQLAQEAAAKRAKDAADRARELAEAQQHLSLLQQIEDKIKAKKGEQQAVTGNIGDHPQKLADIQKEIDELEEYRQKLLGKWKDKAAAKAKKDAEKDAEDRKKEHDQIMADFYRFQQNVHVAQEKVNADRLSDDERELQQIDQKYDELIDKALQFANNEKLTKEEQRAALAEIDKLYDAREIERFDKKAEQLKKRQAVLFEQQKAEVEAQEALKVLLAQAEVDATDPKEGGDPDEHKNARVKLEQAQVSQIIHARDIELAELDKLREKDLLSEEDVAERKKLINAKAGVAIAATHKKTAEEIRQENLAMIDQYAQRAQEMMTSFMGLATQYSVNQGKKEEKERKQKTKDLDQQLKQKLITEEQYNTKKNDLDAEYDKKASLRQQEQAEIQKELNIFNATMSGISAVVKTLAELGPIAGPPMAAVVGAMAAAQVAMIIATPIPEFREGGFTTEEALALPHQNLSRSSGGMMNSGPFLATVNEAGAEYFVPNRLLSDPRVAPHVQAIEAIRTTGHAGFVAGGHTSTATPGAASYSAPSSTAGAAQPMTEATGQLVVHYLATLTQAWQEGKVIRAEVVPEELARTTELKQQIRQDGAY